MKEYSSNEETSSRDILIAENKIKEANKKIEKGAKRSKTSKN